MRAHELRLIQERVDASIAAKQSFFERSSEQLVEAAVAIAEAVRAGGKILLFGNGGSAADCQHIAAEFIHRLERDRRPIPAIALTTDTSALTAIGNDDGYEHVFARQLEALGRPGDVAIGITTSGNSGNVVVGFEAADRLSLTTVGLLGRDGGKCRVLCAHPLIVASPSTQRVQEVHILLGHLLAELVENHLYPPSTPPASEHP